MNALTDRTQAKFRAFIYKTLESLSEDWKSTEYVDENDNQMAPFSREIATWICNQSRPFGSDELEQVIRATERTINPNLIGRVVTDVTDAMLHINGKSTLPEATP